MTFYIDAVFQGVTDAPFTKDRNYPLAVRQSTVGKTILVIMIQGNKRETSIRHKYASLKDLLRDWKIGNVEEVNGDD